MRKITLTKKEELSSRLYDVARHVNKKSITQEDLGCMIRDMELSLEILIQAYREDNVNFVNELIEESNLYKEEKNILKEFETEFNKNNILGLNIQVLKQL